MSNIRPLNVVPSVINMMSPIFILLLSASFHCALSEVDTVLQLPSSVATWNLSRCADAMCKPAEVNMNGHHNYQAGQQIFYMGGFDNWMAQNAADATKNKTDVKYRDDYVVTPNLGVHKLHRQKVTWNTARMQCIDEGGHLAVINSNREEAVLLDMMAQEDLATAWLGVHDLYQEGVWTTILDEPLGSTGYTKWTSVIPNDPDNFGGNQHCGILMKQTGMDDIECASLHAFFCELPLVKDSCH